MELTAVPPSESYKLDGHIAIQGTLKKQRILEFGFRGLTLLAAAFILLLLVTVTVVLIFQSLPSIHKFGWQFFTSATWNPVTNEFGALTPIYGTLVTSAIALIFAIPISFGIAVFLTELTPTRLKTPLGGAIELLAAIPSIIYGMWGLFIFAPFFAKHIEPFLKHTFGPLPKIGLLFQGPNMGIGVLTAGLILAIMIIPFISAVMRDVFELIPNVQKEAGYGLGATTWEVVWKIVLPSSKNGVLAGIILGLGRALGETMAVTFVIGNSHQLTPSLLMPGNTISSTLANEFTEAVGPLYTSSLVELGLVLFVISFIVLVIAKLLTWRIGHRAQGRRS